MPSRDMTFREIFDDCKRPLLDFQTRTYDPDVIVILEPHYRIPIPGLPREKRRPRPS